MKLTGSMTEMEYRSDLLSSRKYLYETINGKAVLDVLKRMRGDIKTAYVLAHTPEQGEDIFRILVNGEYVIGFDLQHGNGIREALNVEIYPLRDYERLAGSREARLKLAIALDLCQKDLAKK